MPLTNVVTTTADWGPGGLPRGDVFIQDNPGATVEFNIPTNDPGYSNGVFTIHSLGICRPWPSMGWSWTADGPGFNGRPLIVIDGSQILPDTFTPTSGLLIYSASNQVRNLSFPGI